MIFHTDLVMSTSDRHLLGDALDYCETLGLVHKSVGGDDANWQGSRSRAGALRFKLESHGQLTLDGRGRRRVNAGTSTTVDRFDLPYAATYDEWGWVLSYLFRADPHGHCGKYSYQSEEDFHAQTRGAYRLPRESTDMEITSYEQADAFLRAGADLYHRNIRGMKATQVIRRLGGIALRYHDTDVVFWHEDGSIELTTGGWLTQTTARRISEFTPFRQHTDKGRWMLCTNLVRRSYEYAPLDFVMVPDWDSSVPLVDGMTLACINDRWEVIGGLDMAQVTAEEQWNAKVRVMLARAGRAFKAQTFDADAEPLCTHCEASFQNRREIKPGTEREHYLQHLAAIIAGRAPNHFLKSSAQAVANRTTVYDPEWRTLRSFFASRLLAGNVMGAPSGRKPAAFSHTPTWQNA